MPRILSDIDVADFRERLCDVATRLFAERGPDGFTMRELTAEMQAQKAKEPTPEPNPTPELPAEKFAEVVQFPDKQEPIAYA